MKKIISFFILVTSVCALLTACKVREKAVIFSAADLEGKRIGVQTGTTGELYVKENVKYGRLISFKTGMDAALDLKNGALDAVILDELPAKKIVARNEDLMIIADKFARESYAIAVKKGNAQLLSSINKTIRSIKSDGTYEKLVAAFMPIDGVIKRPHDPSDPRRLSTYRVLK